LTVDQSARPTTRHEQAAATRRQLLQAAHDEFAGVGYRATTVAAITDRARTAHGTFYLYFRNKEDAFCQVIETVMLDEIATATIVPHDLAPRAAVERSIRNFVTVYQRHTGLWRALLEGAFQSSRVQQIWLDLRRQMVMRISDGFAAQQQAGVVRPLDSTMTAHTLGAMVEWSAFTHLVLGEPRPEGATDSDTLVGTLSDLWYRALYGEVDAEG
jgi:AcrR family transcriptional regulator